MGAGLIAPCAGCITVSYKNQTWTADLAADGAIEFEGGLMALWRVGHSAVACCEGDIGMQLI